MKTAVIIPAAGMGTRMGAVKQLLILKDRPVLSHTLAAFEEHEEINEIILVAPAESMEEIQIKAIFPYGFKKISAVVQGGLHRQESVWAGLNHLSQDVAWILIHDGARPLVTKQVISDVLAYVRKGVAAVSGVKSKDTIKLTEDDIVKDTPARDYAWLVQTPQGFPHNLIKEAHIKALAEGFIGTDDAMLVERLNVPVYMVEGDYRNIKLTTREDVKIAEALIT